MEQKELLKAHQRMVMIAAAFIGGCTMMAVVFYFLVTSGQISSSAQDVGALRPMVIFFSVGGLIASWVFKRVALTKRQEIGKPINKDINQVISRLTTTTLVSLAMCEGVVLLGLILAFMSQQVGDFILPVLLGAVGFAIHFPRYAQWEQWIQN